MAKALYINPAILKWARERAHFSLEEVATKAHVSKEDIEIWEAGADVPTYAKLQELAKIYRRPLGLFWLPELPKTGFTILKDFRRVEAKGEYSSTLALLIKHIQELQLTAKEILEEERMEALPFVGSVSISDSHKEVAEKILSMLQVNMEEKDLLKHITDCAERAGIFVCKSSGLNTRNIISVNEARGFAISDPIAPFIFINTSDSKTAQLFTLLHELAHIWLNSSGISRDIDAEGLELEEAFCNQVAAEALMPAERIRSIFTESPSFEDIKRVAKIFQVSPHALAFRTYKLGILNIAGYRSIKSDIDEVLNRLDLTPKPKTESGPNGNLLIVLRNSRKYTSLVYNKYTEGKLDALVASRMLGMKLKGFGNILSWI